MNAEQQRTFNYYQERYEHAVMQRVNGHVNTPAEIDRYNQAWIGYFGYRRFLRSLGIDIEAVA